MTDLDQRTLVALRRSIEKWERNAEAKTPDEYRIGRSDCALCSVFYRLGEPVDLSCKGCPVNSATGRQGCRQTPYVRAEYVHYEWARAYYYMASKAVYAAARATALAAAREEADFLRSLWPAGAVINDDGAA